MGDRALFFDFVDQQDYVANPDGPPLPDRQYFAADWAAMFRNIFTDGIIGSIDGNNLKVTPTSPEGMQLQVLPGGAWINGKYWEIYTTPELVTIDPNNSGYDRIDRVVTRIDFEARDIYPHVIKGTPAQSPVAPPIVRDAQFYDLRKARVLVANSALSLGSGALADERGTQARLLDSYVAPRHEVQFLYYNSSNVTLGSIPTVGAANIVKPSGWNKFDAYLFGYCSISVPNGSAPGSVAQRRVRMDVEAPGDTVVYRNYLTPISVIPNLGGTDSDSFFYPLVDLEDTTHTRLRLYYESGPSTVIVNVRRAFAIKFWKE